MLKGKRDTALKNEIFDIKGKIALITGSTQGLGYTFAKGYLEAGAKVVLNGRNAEKLDMAVKTLRSEGFNDVYGYAFDVAEQAEVQRAVQAIEREVGPIDILVNNAGIHQRAMLDEMTLAQWENVIRTNLTGAFIVGQSVAKRMMERGHGKLINITSLNSELARVNIANYSSAKGGLKMLTKSMATEWGRKGITVNAIAPGYFHTELTQPLMADPAFDGWVKSEVPLGRWGEPEDLIGTAIFLASPASDYINGFTIAVDGGWQASL